MITKTSRQYYLKAGEWSSTGPLDYHEENSCGKITDHINTKFQGIETVFSYLFDDPTLIQYELGCLRYKKIMI